MVIVELWLFTLPVGWICVGISVPTSQSKKHTWYGWLETTTDSHCECGSEWCVQSIYQGLATNSGYVLSLYEHWNRIQLQETHAILIGYKVERENISMNVYFKKVDVKRQNIVMCQWLEDNCRKSSNQQSATEVDSTLPSNISSHMSLNHTKVNNFPHSEREGRRLYHLCHKMKRKRKHSHGAFIVDICLLTCLHVFPASEVMNTLTLLLVSSEPMDPGGEVPFREHTEDTTSD